jgi:replication factor A1
MSQPLLKRKLDAIAASDQKELATSTTSSSSAGPEISYGSIDKLNANSDSNIIIRVRIMEKYPIRTWNKPETTGSGCLFSFDVSDAHPDLNPNVPGTVINCTAFNDVCKKYEPILEIGQIYNIRGFKVKKKNSKFNSLPHPFEIQLDRDCTIEPTSYKQGGGVGYQIPSLQFHKLSEIKNMELESTVNTVVFVLARGEIIHYNDKVTGEPKMRRTIHFIDDTRHEISMTIHGPDKCNNELFAENNVLILRRVIFCAWNDDRSLKMIKNSIVVNGTPDLPEALPLITWIQQTTDPERMAGIVKISKDTTKRSLEKRMTCAKLIEMLIAGGSAKWNDLNIDQTALDATTGNNIIFKLTAVIKEIKYERERPVTFVSCNTCFRKVKGEKNGFKCENCDSFIPKPSRAYLLNAVLYDDTGSCDVTIFHSVSRQMIKHDAQELWQAALSASLPVNNYNNDEGEENKDPNTQSGGQVLVNLIGDQIAYREYIFNLRENVDPKTGKIQMIVTKANQFEEAYELDREEKLLYNDLNADV